MLTLFVRLSPCYPCFMQIDLKYAEMKLGFGRLQLGHWLAAANSANRLKMSTHLSFSLLSLFFVGSQ